MEHTDKYFELITTVLERLTKNKDKILAGKTGFIFDREVEIKPEYRQDILHLQKFIGLNIFVTSLNYNEKKIERLLQHAQVLLEHVKIRIPLIKECSTEQLTTIYLTASVGMTGGIGHERVMNIIEEELLERKKPKTPA